MKNIVEFEENLDKSLESIGKDSYSEESILGFTLVGILITALTVLLFGSLIVFVIVTVKIDKGVKKILDDIISRNKKDIEKVITDRVKGYDKDIYSVSTLKKFFETVDTKKRNGTYEKVIKKRYGDKDMYKGDGSFNITNSNCINFSSFLMANGCLKEDLRDIEELVDMGMQTSYFDEDDFGSLEDVAYLDGMIDTYMRILVLNHLNKTKSFKFSMSRRGNKGQTVYESFEGINMKNKDSINAYLFSTPSSRDVYIALDYDLRFNYDANIENNVGTIYFDDKEYK